MKTHNNIVTQLPPRKPSQSIIGTVNRYVEQLIISKNKEQIDHILQRLYEIDCPMKVFELSRIEHVLTRYKDRSYLYQVNKLNQKFAELRRDQKKEEVKEDEEYDPEFPEIRSSGEMEQYPLPKSSKLLSHFAEYVPTPVSPSSSASSSPSEGSTC